MYIPKNSLEDNRFGPFRVLLQNPFYLSYEVIEKNLNRCWATHIVEKARKIFVGKITNLFTRTPVDELIFIEFNQIEDYFEEKWQKAWNNKENKPYEKSAYEIIDKIIEFYFLLKLENEQMNFRRLKIMPLNFLEFLFRQINKSWIFIEENPFVSFYKQLEEDEKINHYLRFYKFIDNAIYGDESVFMTLEDHLDRINQVKDEEFINFKVKNIKEDCQNLQRIHLYRRIESLKMQKEEILSYCEPFKKLRDFLNEIEILK